MGAQGAAMNQNRFSFTLWRAKGNEACYGIFHRTITSTFKLAALPFSKKPQLLCFYMIRGTLDFKGRVASFRF